MRDKEHKHTWLPLMQQVFLRVSIVDESDTLYHQFVWMVLMCGLARPVDPKIQHKNTLGIQS